MNNKELFEKINEILLKSLKPSEDLERLIIEGYLDKEPFNKIKKLNNIEQNPKYHPEGSVLKHVLLVVDLASEYKKYSNDEKVFMWAALLHDIGKLTTTRVRKNRITSYNHDTEGKDIAMNILNELTDDEAFWKGCEGCINHDILVAKNRKFCICTAMLYDPALHEEDTI